MTVTGNGPSVFITGGTGFIGSYLLDEIHRQGYRITLLVRSAQRLQIEGRPELPPNVELVVGDICRPESYRHRLTGHQAMVHLAADYRVGLPATRRARRAMYYTNVVGTQTLFDEAEKADIPQMVYVSSTAALGETHGQLPDENGRHNGVFRSYYEETKHIAHELVAERQRLGMPINIAIPGGAFGPGDSSILSQTIDAFFGGKFLFRWKPPAASSFVALIGFAMGWLSFYRRTFSGKRSCLPVRISPCRKFLPCWPAPQEGIFQR